MKYLMGYQPRGGVFTSKHFKTKSIHPTREAAARAMKRAKKNFPKCTGAICPRYEVIAERTLKIRENQLSVRFSRIRKRAARKAVEYKKKYNVKPSFVLCPHCKAKSKKLYSEMGGLHTRLCQNGHRFEYDTYMMGGRGALELLDLRPR